LLNEGDGSFPAVLDRYIIRPDCWRQGGPDCRFGRTELQDHPQQLDEALANKPKAFLFNNPANPTGMVYDESEVAGWLMSR
jgi:hypothetical protein